MPVVSTLLSTPSLAAKRHRIITKHYYYETLLLRNIIIMKNYENYENEI